MSRAPGSFYVECATRACRIGYSFSFCCFRFICRGYRNVLYICFLRRARCLSWRVFHGYLFLIRDDL